MLVCMVDLNLADVGKDKFDMSRVRINLAV